MKILLITETIPFPARNGRELPTAEIFQRMANDAKVDTIVISNDKKDFDKRLANLPSKFGFCKRIGHKNIKSKFKLVAQELIGKQPSYFSKSFDIEEIKNAIGPNTYDYVWISPAALYTFVQCLKNNNFIPFDKVAIGMNDLKSGMYYDAIHEAIGFRVLHLPYFMRFFRSFFMKKAERNFLNQVDFIHVQTTSEANKTQKVIKVKESKLSPIVIAPNGYKKELLACNYKGNESKNILYMTQLNQGRKIESNWFIKNIWPLVHKEIPEAKLLIPGKIADINDPSIAFLKNAPNVELLGFVKDLEDLLGNVRMGVVPIFHGTGLINRILDNLTAGIPTVSTPNAIATFPSLKIDKEILAANDAQSFAQKTISLYKDLEARKKISQTGRNYVLQNHPDWDATADIIHENLKKIVAK